MKNEKYLMCAIALFLICIITFLGMSLFKSNAKEEYLTGLKTAYREEYNAEVSRVNKYNDNLTKEYERKLAEYEAALNESEEYQQYLENLDAYDEQYKIEYEKWQQECEIISAKYNEQLEAWEKECEKIGEKYFAQYIRESGLNQLIVTYDFYKKGYHGVEIHDDNYDELYFWGNESELYNDTYGIYYEDYWDYVSDEDRVGKHWECTAYLNGEVLSEYSVMNFNIGDTLKVKFVLTEETGRTKTLSETYTVTSDFYTYWSQTQKLTYSITEQTDLVCELETKPEVQLDMEDILGDCEYPDAPEEPVLPDVPAYTPPEFHGDSALAQKPEAPVEEKVTMIAPESKDWSYEMGNIPEEVYEYTGYQKLFVWVMAALALADLFFAFHPTKKKAET